MVSVMVKYKNIFLFATIAFFLGSLGFMGMGVIKEEYGPNAAVAYVGGAKIKVRDFDNSYRIAERNQRESGEDLSDAAPLRLRQEVLQDMITKEILAQSAKKYGLYVPDIEAGYDIKSSFSDGGNFDKKIYVWLVRNHFGMNPAQYEEMFKKQKLGDKFKSVLVLSSKVTPQEAEFFLQQGAPAKGEPQPDLQTMALAVTQVKAQSLANSFTKEFNEREKVELLHQDRILGQSAAQ